MKVFHILLLLLAMGACSHKKMCHEGSSCHKQESYKKPEQKALVSYDGHCPMGLTKKQKVKAHHQYKVEYKGKHYVYSLPEARDTFMS
jgi:hypothetical protein